MTQDLKEQPEDDEQEPSFEILLGAVTYYLYRLVGSPYGNNVGGFQQWADNIQKVFIGDLGQEMGWTKAEVSEFLEQTSSEEATENEA